MRGLSEKQIDSLTLQPWFVPRSTFVTIARLVPREYLLRMRDYFDRYGCMHCKSRTKPYGSNGMCKLCIHEISRRIRRCWKRRVKKLNAEGRNHEIREIVSNAKIAHDLLRDLAPSKQNRKASLSISNPVSALAVLSPRTGVVSGRILSHAQPTGAESASRDGLRNGTRRQRRQE
jgi:hypothetical protein